MNKRLEKVIERMKDRGLSQLLISDPGSIYYLTGISVDPGERFFGLIVRESGETSLIVNRLFSVPKTDIETVWLGDTDSVSEAVARLIDRKAELGVDKLLPARFLIPIRDKLEGGKTVLGSDCVDWVRAVKDEEEREKMREASGINDIVIEEAAAFIKEGVTEKEVADYLVGRYAFYGCEGVSFEPIVSFGKGCKLNGYCSDMTRTYFFKKADPEYAAIHDLVREANTIAESVIRPGVRLCDIDAAAREHIASAGYGEYFTHRLGHFIGLEVHEYGDVSAAFDKAVEPGMCFSCEPGVYLPGRFGVRIEDLVIVTEEGCEVINHVDKHYRVIA